MHWSISLVYLLLPSGGDYTPTMQKCECRKQVFSNKVNNK